MQQSDIGDEHGAGSTLAASGAATTRPPSTVLLVEDEGFVREVACEVLSRAGYRVLTARNAAEAVELFREHAGTVQLLLTDVVLPDRNGLDLARELATADWGIKSIFVSGYPENSITRQEPRQAGWFYLAKPFSGTSLLHKISEALPGEISGD